MDGDEISYLNEDKSGSYLGLGFGNAAMPAYASEDDPVKLGSVYKLYGGYMFSNWFGIESAYIKSTGYTCKTEGQDQYGMCEGGKDYQGGDVYSTSIVLSSIADIPFTDNFSGLVSIGMHTTEFEQPYENQKGNGLHLGLGLEYDFTRKISANIKYDFMSNSASDYNTEIIDDVYTATISIRYKFKK
jgi:opacity protein-like surface antigen